VSGTAASTALDMRPVNWSTDREARGRAPDRGPRCTEADCPVRYAAGPSRPCPEHGDSPAALARRERIRAELARIARTAGRRAAAAALLRDSRRSDRSAAAEAGVSYQVAGRTRAELEAAGLIPAWRAAGRAGLRRGQSGRWESAAAPPAVTARAGLARAAGRAARAAVAARPVVIVPCACGCGELFDRGSRPDRRFASDLHRKRQKRRNERDRGRPRC
jgi:hypothetical protein